MITVKKMKKWWIWTFRRPTYVRTSPTPRGLILGTLEDPDEGSEVHPVGYGHRKKKKKKGSNGYQKTASFRCQGENDDYKTVSTVETVPFEKAARA